jgi:hypothetical protein
MLLSNTPNPQVPNTSLLSDSEKLGPVATDTLDRAVQGAHKAVDRFADSAVPTVRHMAQTGDAWTASARATVRAQPLMALIAAFAVGALVGRITR